MSMAGQSESDEIFVWRVKTKELKMTWSSVLFFLSQWENKTDDLIAIGSFIFGIQIKMSSDLLCLTIFNLLHPTLTFSSLIINKAHHVRSQW